MKIEDLISEFKMIPDYRKGNAIRHNLEDILMIALLASICNNDTFYEMELFGKHHEKEFKKFLELPNGIPSHDTFGEVFSKLDPNNLKKILDIWLKLLKDKLNANSIIAIDGKTVRGSRKANKKPKHIISAFATEYKVVLGQLSVEEKTNEITAIPELLDLLSVKGSIITIDAIGTQKEIVNKISEKKGYYLLALKKNHKTFYEDVQLYFEDKEIIKKADYYETIEKGHGRIESRKCFLIKEVDWLENKEEWKDLRGIAMIESQIENILSGKISKEKRYYITSCEGKDLNAKRILEVKRSHWAIENELHWHLDITFKEDESQVYIKNAVENLNIMRKFTLRMMKNETKRKESMRIKRKMCSWDIGYAYKVIKSS